MPNYPDFTCCNWLHQHAKSILAFYRPIAFDAKGGFFHSYSDNGTIIDPNIRHLVSSTRWVFNFAHAYRHGYGDIYRNFAVHALAFVEKHRLSTGHYAWEIDRKGNVIDGRAMAYGQAFTLLAGASALAIGIQEGEKTIQNAWEILDTYFWEANQNAYADERDQCLQHLDDYRGQNANMHACEAMIAAYKATKKRKYLERAIVLADRFAFDFAQNAQDSTIHIWEHYTANWHKNWDYNRDKPDDLFKPWGYQPGHQCEWAKLLLQIDDITPHTRYYKRAQQLFDTAWLRGWDRQYGGLVYGYAPSAHKNIQKTNHNFSDSHKYFWVQAEAIAAAWRLYAKSRHQHQRSRYLCAYIQLWQYAWNTMIDHQYGAWFRIRTREGKPVDTYKSPPGKVDYHTLGSCWDIIETSATIQN